MSGELLVSTKEKPGAYDGLVTAKPGEPVFVLQGGDPHGPATVLHWAGLARAAAYALFEAATAEGNEEAQERAKEKLRKATSAEETAFAMQAYQRGETAIDGRAESYGGHVDTVAAAAARDRHTVLVKGADRLYNSIAESIDVAEALAKLREYPEAEVLIRDAAAALRQAAEAIEPRRHMQRKAG